MVSGSRVMRRSWWALVSFSHFFPLRWPMAFSRWSTPVV